MIKCILGVTLWILIILMRDELRPALVYDVAKDEWARFLTWQGSAMNAKSFSSVVSSMSLAGTAQMQGMFERSAEALDFANWQWDNVEEDFLEASTCPRTCVDGGDMGMYMCHGGEVVALQDSRWHSSQDASWDSPHSLHDNMGGEAVSYCLQKLWWSLRGVHVGFEES